MDLLFQLTLYALCLAEIITDIYIQTTSRPLGDPHPNNPQCSVQASLFASYPTAKFCIFVFLCKCVEESGRAIVCLW